MANGETMVRVPDVLLDAFRNELQKETLYHHSGKKVSAQVTGIDVFGQMSQKQMTSLALLMWLKSNMDERDYFLLTQMLGKQVISSSTVDLALNRLHEKEHVVVDPLILQEMFGMLVEQSNELNSYIKWSKESMSRLFTLTKRSGQFLTRGLSSLIGFQMNTRDLSYKESFTDEDAQRVYQTLMEIAADGGLV